MTISLVQSGSATATSGSTVTVTLGAGTTAGNCLIVCAGTLQSSANPAVSGITLGGSAGNFAVAKKLNAAGIRNCETWADPNCAGGQTSVVVSFSGGSGSALRMNVWVMEWSGLATSSVTDATSSGSSSSSSSFSSGSTGTLGQASELVVGADMGDSPTGPGSPWTNLTGLVSSGGFLIGYQVVSATTALTYSGTDVNTFWSAVIASFKGAGAASIAEIDTGAAADTITTQITAIPPAVTSAPPRPSGPPPPPIAPQVLLVPSGAATPQDTAAAADVIVVTAETIPLADVGAAADYSSSQIFQADQAGAADTIAVAASLPLTDTTGAATDLGGNVPAVQVNWAETGAALDKAGSAGLSEMDAAGAADVLAVAATGIAFADKAGASDAWGQSAAVGGSGGASTPQAYPGTSQVAVAAPGSSVWSYLGSIGTITALSYGFKFPGGCDQLTCTVMVPASYRTQLFDDGWQVRVTRGGHTVWSGVLDEPVPTATTGWTLTAAGVGNLGTNFLATYTDTWPTGEPDESIDNAIGRGLPWINPGVGAPSGLWLGQSVDSGAQNITALLNLACTRGGLAWTVNSQPGGQIGNDLAVLPLPSAPNRLLVCTTPVARTLAAAVRAIFVRYEITADSTTGSSPAPATYGLVEVQNSAAAPYSAGALEQYVDLSDAGPMTATQAEQIAAYVLEAFQQISFAGSFAAHYGQLLNLGGTPVDPGTDQAGNVVRLVLLDFAFGGSVIPQPAEFIVGSYSWDDFAQVATIQAYNTLNQSLSSLLGLESTLLTPIQAASG